MPRPRAARFGTLLIVITAAKCDAGESLFSWEVAAEVGKDTAGSRTTAVPTTPQHHGRRGQEELNHVTL